MIIIIPVITAFILVNSVYSQDGIKIPVAVVDEDNTNFSKFLADGITANKALKVSITNKKSAEQLVSANTLEAAFVIPKGFEEKLKHEEFNGLITMIKNPRSISAEMIGEGIASSAIKLLCASIASNKVVSEYSKLTGLSDKEKEALWLEAWKHTEEQWNQPEPLMKVDISKINASNARNRAVDSKDSRIILGVISAFLVFFLLQGSWWLSEEERNGTIYRIKLSKVSSWDLIAGNVLFLLLAGISTAAIYLLIFNGIFGIRIDLTFNLFIALVSYIFFISSIVFIFSSFLSPVQLGIFIPVFSLFTALAGGCFWDISLLDKSIGLISLFTPQGWFLKMLDSPDASFIINLLFIFVGIAMIIVSYFRISTYKRVL